MKHFGVGTMFSILFCGIFFLGYAAADSNCLIKRYGENKIVCVCNSEHCDYYFVDITPDKVNVVTSTQAGARYAKTVQDIESDATSANLISIDRSKKYQKIDGFGGAFTDSTGINIMLLPAAAGDHLMRSYFTGMGSMYNLCRVPMGGTDFSLHGYSYDDGGVDMCLKNFKLADEDFKYKIPLMKKALNLSMYQTQLKFFASTWIAPKWMKTNEEYKGGSIKRKYYKAWANYFVKFLDEYNKQGLNFWAITTGNEPSLANISMAKIPSVGWSSENASLWIRDYLGPIIRSSKFSKINIVAIDDQRLYFKDYVTNLMKNETTRNYVDGFGVHWYLDSLVSPSILSETHEDFPDKFILSTESSNGFRPWQTHVVLGSWERGEKYANDIINDLNNWVTGWVDWNLALDTQGGPTYINNFIDAPIIVNASAEEFYKQPMYYAIGHFSKFIPVGSTRIHVTTDLDLPMVAFIQPEPDEKAVLVILNKFNHSICVSVEDGSKYINVELKNKSITTLIY